MRAFFCHKILTVLMVSAIGCGAVSAKEGGDKLSTEELEKLDELRLDYDVAREEIQQKQWVEPMEKLRARYRDRMGKLQLELAKTGALEKALAAREAEKNEPTNSTINENVPEVAAVQKIFLDAQTEILLRVDKSFTELARSQFKKLSIIKGRLTKVNRLDSALIVGLAIKEIAKDVKGGEEGLEGSSGSTASSRPKRNDGLLTIKPTPLSEFEWAAKNGEVEIRKFIGTAINVSIPDEIEGMPVTSIGSSAFNGAALTKVIIPKGVTHIHYGAFSECSSLTSVVLPEGLIDIGSSVFRRCSALANIAFPESVIKIDDSAFSYCISLVSVVLPERLTVIGGSAFQNCNNLTSVVFPKGLTGIGSAAFVSCTSLEEVTIPDKVTNIGTYSFARCKNLKSAVFQGDAPKVGDKAFSGALISTIYRKPDAKGWGDTFADRPVKLSRRRL